MYVHTNHVEIIFPLLAYASTKLTLIAPDLPTHITHHTVMCACKNICMCICVTCTTRVYICMST